MYIAGERDEERGRGKRGQKMMTREDSACTCTSIMNRITDKLLSQ